VGVFTLLLVPLLIIIISITVSGRTGQSPAPPPAVQGGVVVNTWWGGTTSAALEALREGMCALDAAQAACAATELSMAFGDRTVGPDGSPDTSGETTLDALLQEGESLHVGAVAYLRRVPSAIRAARAVMRFTTHSLLAGDGAAALAISLGGQAESTLTGNVSARMYADWRAAACQPNFYDPGAVVGATEGCGPYAPAEGLGRALGAHEPWASLGDHDTVGVCVRDAAGGLAVGVSSNGANHKIAGRVGDAPVPGAGGYADARFGCAACTGDGDITMRFLPSYQAVEFMRGGLECVSAPRLGIPRSRSPSAQAACEAAVRRIMERVAEFSIGLVCLDKYGRTGAASHGWGGGQFAACSAAEASGSPPNCTRLTALR